MRSLKGFVTVDTLINNAPNTLSPIGEFSTWSKTYSTDPREYYDNTYPDYKLIAMSVKSIDSGVSTQIQVDSAVSSLTLQIAQSIFTQIQAQNLSLQDLIDYITIQFPTTALFNCGAFVSTSDNLYRLPSWFSYNYTDTGGNLWSVRIWMADSAFREEYDEYSITVVPPLADINLIATLSAQNLQTQLQAVTMDDMMDTIQAAKQGNPETYTRSTTYDYVRSGVTTGAIRVVFSAIIYGKLGDNTDSIREAIQSYIAANVTSSDNLAAITAYLPDIYRSTEFIFAPRWDKVAIADLTIQQGIFSPISEASDTLTYLNGLIKNDIYTANHISLYGCSFSVMYRSLAIAAIGCPQNRDSKIRITQFFPDFTIIPSITPLDYNRMGDNTRAFVERMNELIVYADTATDATVLPAHVRRTYRPYTNSSGTTYRLLFLSSTINYSDLGSIQLLVASRSNPV